MAKILFDYRPHYHAIVFGLKLDDLIPFQKNEIGDWLYTSKTLESIWKKGFCLVGAATHESIGYVAGYVTKKLYGNDAELYKKLNIVPPFLVMSRKPGIGRQFYEDNKEKLFEETKYFFPTRDGVGAAVPGRYYNNLFELDYGSGAVAVRKDYLKFIYDQQNKLKLSNTDKNYLDYLETEEYIKTKKTKILERSDI